MRVAPAALLVAMVYVESTRCNQASGRETWLRSSQTEPPAPAGSRGKERGREPVRSNPE